jgi:hypothetical protein
MDIYASPSPHDNFQFSEVNAAWKDADATTQQLVAQSSVQKNQPSRTEDSPEHSAVFTSIFVFPFVAWLILIGSLLMRFLSSEKSVSTSTLHRSGYSRAATQKTKQLVPCSRCHYFSSNSYVHCAIHPSKVLTAEAIDCCDYRATAPR